jgi:hypothetical protein
MGFLAHVLVKQKVLMFDPLSFMDNFNDRFFSLVVPHFSNVACHCNLFSFVC